MLGGGYREIVAASSIPTAVAEIQPEPFTRIVVVARRSELLPGRLPTLIVAARLAAKLEDRECPLVIGPLDRATVERAGVELPEEMTSLGPIDDATDCLTTATRPGDLVIAPIDQGITSSLISLHDAGRSVLAVAHNPGSEIRLTGSTLTFPVAGSVGPT